MQTSGSRELETAYWSTRFPSKEMCMSDVQWLESLRVGCARGRIILSASRSTDPIDEIASLWLRIQGGYDYHMSYVEMHDV